MKINHFLAAIAALAFITSCTIQKRTVNKGYFVQWHWDKKVKNNPTEESQSVASLEKVSEQILGKSEQLAPEVNVPVEQNSVEETSNNPIEAPQPNPLLPQNKKANGEQTLKITEKAPHIIKKQFAKPAAAMDGELWINIGLTIVFIGLAILFLILAMNATGILMWVYWGACALSFVLFVTQVIDLIMW